MCREGSETENRACFERTSPVMPWEEVDPVFLNYAPGKLCRRPYPNHPRGCPNYKKKKGCPPRAKPLGLILDLSVTVFAVWNVFPFRQHCRRMRKKHPEWSKRQIQNCYYWQGTARKQLREEVKRFFSCEVGVRAYDHPKTVWCPEAHGINLTATMDFGFRIKLEWPPKVHTYQIVLVGEDKTFRKKRRTCT